MILKELKPRKALNKAFLKVKPNRTEIEGFKTNLITLLDRTNDRESEEFHKNLVIDFLKKTYYDPNYFLNTKGRNDLVIHNGQDAKTTVGVIIEAKKPTNKTEMITTKKLNAKAFQELVLYYLRERITYKNLEVKHLVATNINEWFIFDEHLFERFFAQNKSFVRQFENFEASKKATDVFYKEIAEPFIASITSEIEFTYFNIQDFQKPLRNTDKADDNSLIALFKLLSPEHLLKLPFTNDSNSLDKRFYSELLHIIGLTETKEGGKKLIERNKEAERNTGTILEDAIIQLDSLDKLSRLEKPNQFGNTQQERLFNVALELSITWINRILFLKLLEAQLITYHKGDKSFSFLNLDKIKNYDDLNSLFFQVLARKYDERNEDVKKIFEKVPYLNSSLFEPTDMEQVTLFISNLKDDKTIPIFSQTVLKDQQGKKRTGNISTLQYLFEFLDAYDFGSEGREEIQEDNKTLINASVLGLIFEKINGYKDGSFFTPGFITMYMCRETIRKAVLQKFNEAATPLLRGAGGVSRREIIPYNPALKELARELRNKSTKSEIILWKELKGKFEGKYDFHRQKPLDNFIADFFCYELKLVIEIDGATHDWEETQQKDFQKERKLNELGLNVLRFPDSDIFKHLENTVSTIKNYIEGFEKGDLSELKYEDSPLNPLTGNEAIINTPLNPLSRGDFNSLDEVYEQIGEGKLFNRQQANDIVNSIKICDPAVGSGHFLVSALNEMIAVKNDLKILQDRDGKRLKEYQVEVVNDELIVTDEEGELFEYTPPSPLERGNRGVSESQRIQETLFHEKQTIIENCLFGVDINSNSVKICRLRLWIELLKNAYYKNATELETLPNIDINIKCGNSLVSRFAIDADLKQALKKSKWTIDSYRIAVDTYRNAESKEQKREMEILIADIKSDFRSEISKNDPKLARLYKLSGELTNLTTQKGLFELAPKEKKEWNQKVEKLSAEVKKLETEIEEIKANKIFENAFEWRIEFPEVLNDDGDFVGFDVVIGNPPYIRQENIEKRYKEIYLENFKNVGVSTADIYIYFFGLSFNILAEKGILGFITLNKWLKTKYGINLRNTLKNKEVTKIIDFFELPIFEEASTDSAITFFQNKNSTSQSQYIGVKTLKDINLYDLEFFNNINIIKDETEWKFVSNKKEIMLDKIEKNKIKLIDFVNGKFHYGIKTGLNKAFIINDEIKEQLYKEDEKSNEILKKYIQPTSIKKFSAEWKNEWIINTHNGLKEKNIKPIETINYNSVYNYLSSFLPEIEERQDKGVHWSNLRNCAYIQEFENPKIIFIHTAKNHQFYFDDEGYYINNSCYMIITESKFLWAFLNSKLFDWYKKIKFVAYGDADDKGRVKLDYNKMITVPIPKLTEENEKVFTEQYKKIISLKKQTPSADTSDLEIQIDRLVYQLYELTDEEIKIIENN